jgi:hypothetical protein
MDVELTEYGNGGDLRILGNDVVVNYGVENMPYIAMFGGAKWWGNELLLQDLDLQFLSETNALLLTTPLSSQGRQLIDAAVRRDLQFLVNDVPNTVLITETIITDDNRLSIYVNFGGAQFYALWNPDTQMLQPARVPFNSVTQFDPVYDVNVGSPSVVHIVAIDEAHPSGIANSVKRFYFTLYNPNTDMPDYVMTIRIGGLKELRINFGFSYLNKAFNYTDAAGVTHNGLFKEGFIDF